MTWAGSGLHSAGMFLLFATSPSAIVSLRILYNYHIQFACILRGPLPRLGDCVLFAEVTSGIRQRLFCVPHKYCLFNTNSLTTQQATRFSRTSPGVRQEKSEDSIQHLRHIKGSLGPIIGEQGREVNRPVLSNVRVVGLGSEDNPRRLEGLGGNGVSL